MTITVLTLFPGLLRPFVKSSIIGKSSSRSGLKVRLVDFRKFAEDKRHTVDGYQAGGGPGMVIMAEPVVTAIEKFKTPQTRVVLLTPQGKSFTQRRAIELAQSGQDLIFLCGRYEGFDERIMPYVDEEISLGDFVTMGGEVVAAAIIEALARLIPGTINSKSLLDESHNSSLLDYPVYTKPNLWRGQPIPPVLLSGNHKEINDFRQKQRELSTKKKRPDLYRKFTKISKGAIENGKN